MRITTWNCNASPSIRHPLSAEWSFVTKSRATDILSSDIAVLQEIANPGTPDSQHRVWRGNSISRGIAVISKVGFVLETVGGFSSSRSVIPIVVHAPVSFNLLAVW